MKLGGNGPFNFPLSVLEENGYIRIVGADGEWLAATTGQPDEPGIIRQRQLARLLVEAANRVHKKKKGKRR